MARYNPNDQSNMSLQCLSFTSHSIFKGGYTSQWLGGKRASRLPSDVVVYKPNASGELVRSHVADYRRK